jgi:hypothetical protein
MRKFDAATAPTNISKTFPCMHAHCQLNRHTLEWYAGSVACLRGGTASSSTPGAPPLADISFFFPNISFTEWTNKNTKILLR